jgi:hypothetical protein
MAVMVDVDEGVEGEGAEAETLETTEDTVERSTVGRARLGWMRLAGERLTFLWELVKLWFILALGIEICVV